jgi:eukaryotic-like serine/threonine-protein kinase
MFRADNSLISKSVYEFGKFRLDPRERVIESAGQRLSITPKALDVLIMLVERRGRIVEKEDLMKTVWPETFVEETNLSFNISVLRKLFGESGAEPHFIETVPKRGYRFIAEVVEVPLGEVARQEPAPQKTVRRTFAQPWTFAGLLFILVIAGVLTYYFRRTPKLTDKDKIVLADFMNKTGDQVFDGTLRQGLAVELEQSPFLSLVSEDQIQRTLGLMGQPADAPLTPQLARDVCERTGSAAVLDGSIARIGSRYVLTLRARNCRNGDILDDEQTQAARKEDVLDALSRIASKFRTQVGESLATVEKHSTPLAEATTPSLEALKAFTTGWKVAHTAHSSAALPLFKRAIEIDPKFAMAYAGLGSMYSDLGESVLSAANASKAYQLQDRASENERFFINATYDQQVTGNLERVQQTLESWAQAYPRAIDAHGLLAGFIYPSLAKHEKGVEEAKKAIGLDPDFVFGYVELATDYQFLDRLEEAEGTFQRAAQRNLEIPELLEQRYDLAFLRGDKAEMEHLVALSQGKTGVEDWISQHEALALAYYGHLQQARRKSRSAVDLARQASQSERAALLETGAALREAFFGNTQAAQRGAMEALKLSKGRDVEYGAGLALAVSGDSAAAQTLANDLAKRFPEDTSARTSYLPVLRAVIALDQGEPVRAVEMLQAAVPYEFGVPLSWFEGFFGALYPVYVRGEVYRKAKRGAEAAVEFQRILDHRGIVASDPIGAIARLQLARALAMSGQIAKAKTAYQDFLTLWKSADPDIPILRQAKAEYAKL